MATITLNTDDLTGETLPDGTPTTTITITDVRWTEAVGPSFELDLSDDSFKKLVTALRRYADKGRAVSPVKSAMASVDATEAKEARAWALANPSLLPDGVKANERGKVSAAVIDAYRAQVQSAE